MSIQSNFPSLKPTLLLDFANTKQLDNRITFTRSTPAVYYDGKTTAMAEQNGIYPSTNLASSPQASGVTITNNPAGITAPDGTITTSKFVASADSGFHYARAAGGLGPPKLDTAYTFSFYAKPAGFNFVSAQLSGGYGSGGARSTITVDVSNGTIGGFTASQNMVNLSSTATSVGNGWYRVTVTGTPVAQNSAPTMTGYIIGSSSTNISGATNGGECTPIFTGDGTNGVYVWGFQVENRSSATAYTATTTQPITNYVPVLLSAGGNQPRFDCNPTTGESLGLLIEEQRSNVAPYSADLGNASAWTQASLTVISNANIAPDGSLSATRLVATTGNFDHDLYRGFSLSSVPYTLSVYAKYSGAHLALSAGVSNPWAGCIFDLQNGVAKTPQGNGMTCTASIQSVGNGWYRCSITFTATSSYAMYTIISTTNDVNATMGGYGFIAYAGDGWSGIQVWGAQLEAGAFASSYIPTTGSAATRTADDAIMTGNNFNSWFQPQQGSLYIESSYLKSGTRGLFQIGSSIENRYGFYTPDQALNYFDGSVPFSTSFSSTSSKIACSLVNYDIAVSFNNSTTTAVGGRSLLNVDKLTIGSATYGGEHICGTIKKIAYYPARLTNAQLQALTS